MMNKIDEKLWQLINGDSDYCSEYTKKKLLSEAKKLILEELLEATSKEYKMYMKKDLAREARAVMYVEEILRRKLA